MPSETSSGREGPDRRPRCRRRGHRPGDPSPSQGLPGDHDHRPVPRGHRARRSAGSSRIASCWSWRIVDRVRRELDRGGAARGPVARNPGRHVQRRTPPRCARRPMARATEPSPRGSTAVLPKRAVQTSTSCLTRWDAPRNRSVAFDPGSLRPTASAMCASSTIYTPGVRWTFAQATGASGRRSPRRATSDIVQLSLVGKHWEPPSSVGRYQQASATLDPVGQFTDLGEALDAVLAPAG